MRPIISIAIIIVIILLCIYSCNPITRDKKEYYTILQGSPHSIPYQIYKHGKTDLSSVDYPVIMKPSIKSSEGYGVKKIKNIDEALKYIKEFDFSHDDTVIIQKFIPYNNEASIMFINDPITKQKYLESIMVKTRINKHGDDTKYFTPGACSNPNINCTNAKLFTGELFAEISKDMCKLPDMNVAKIDIIYKDLDALYSGNYYILEINSRFGTNVAAHQSNKYEYVFNWLIRIIKFGGYNILYGNGLTLQSIIQNAPKYTFVYTKKVIDEKKLPTLI